jgi:hypothetical protein
MLLSHCSLQQALAAMGSDTAALQQLGAVADVLSGCCCNQHCSCIKQCVFLLVAVFHSQIVHAWLPQLLKHHNVATITATGHSLGGVLATLCAFDVAQHLEQNWDKWDKADWKTAKRPQVRLVTFGSPRLGNATFVETFHNLGIAALRIENKGDIVPQVPGVCPHDLRGLDAATYYRLAVSCCCFSCTTLCRS